MWYKSFKSFCFCLKHHFVSFRNMKESLIQQFYQLCIIIHLCTSWHCGGLLCICRAHSNSLDGNYLAPDQKPILVGEFRWLKVNKCCNIIINKNNVLINIDVAIYGEFNLWFFHHIIWKLYTQRNVLFR